MSILYAISSHYDKTVKAPWKERLTLFTMPMIESAGTSKADYVWLPLRFEENQIVIEWKNSWSVEDEI